MANINTNKKALRELIYKKRSEMNLETKKQWDEEILSKILKSEYYKNSRVIFTYVSFQGEVDTIAFLKKALNDGKTICVPKVISKAEGMEAHEITSLDDLELSSYGILEPKIHCPLVNPLDIDLLIMPGVAFDKNNGRMGYGGGFYDRFLKKIKPQAMRIPIAYDFQIFDSIPLDEFDEKVDFIITNGSNSYFPAIDSSFTITEGEP